MLDTLTYSLHTLKLSALDVAEKALMVVCSLVSVAGPTAACPVDYSYKDSTGAYAPKIVAANIDVWAKERVVVGRALAAAIIDEFRS